MRIFVAVILLTAIGLILPCTHAQQTDALRKRFLAIKTKAENGDAKSQCRLAVCYGLGQGVATNDVEAVKWYRKAARQNYAWAQFGLGVCYAHGQGVETNYLEAIKWYRKAAQQNNVAAENNLGACYATGRGVKKHFVKAAHWSRKAAEQNDVNAQTRLGLFYAFGKGVEKDNVEADAWLRLSAEHADPAVKHRDDVLTQFLEKLMSPQQIASVPKRMKELQAQIKIYHGSTSNPR